MILRIVGGVLFAAALGLLLFDVAASRDRRRRGVDTPPYAAGAVTGSISFVILTVLLVLGMDSDLATVALIGSAVFGGISLRLRVKARKVSRTAVEAEPRVDA